MGYSFSGMGFFDCGFHFNSNDLTCTIGSIDDPKSGKGTLTALDGAPTRVEWARRVLTSADLLEALQQNAASVPPDHLLKFIDRYIVVRYAYR